MKILSTIISLLIMSINCSAQAVVPPNIRASSTLEKIFDYTGLDNGEILYGIPLPEGKVIGDTYLDTHWKNSNIMLYEKEQLIEGYPARYDIYLDELEVKGRNGVKVLAGAKVKSFVWADSSTRTPEYYINGKGFKNEDDVPFTGFFQVLSEGSIPLLKKTFIDIKKADYNIQFNVGSPDDKILKKDKFYALKENKLINVPASRKKILTLFNDNTRVVEVFIKENNLTTSNEEDLKLIFEHYNAIPN
jgi:hypothetical protein